MTENKKTLFFKADLGNGNTCLINKRDISTAIGSSGMLWTDIKMKTKQDIKISGGFDLLQSELLDLQDEAED